MTAGGTGTGWTTGAGVGAILTPPLLAVLFFGHAVAGLPFAPFGVFDWIARMLPGAVVTFGIDSIVTVIRGLGVHELSRAAKITEQVLAVVGLFLTGVVLGSLFFAVLGHVRRGRERALPLGLALGLALGCFVLAVTLAVEVDVARFPAGAWILISFAAWGGSLGWSFRRLRLAAPTPAPSATGAPPTGAPREAGPTREPPVQRLDRRRFLVRLGGSAAVVTVAGAGLGTLAELERPRPRFRGLPWSADHPLPNAGAAVKPVPGTRPEFTPVADHYRVDIDASPPVVRESSWRLRVGGLVGRPRQWTLDELRTGYPPLVQFITLSCISNPIGGSLISTQRWTGVPLRRILEEIRPDAAATYVRMRSVDGFHETTAVRDAMADPRIMLTYAWDGLPLPAAHGFPLRIYIPDRYGMKQPKWIESLELMDHPGDGYWVERGWSREAIVQATSVIDTVDVGSVTRQPGKPPRIPVGGIAYAGDRGISRVELRADDGPWEPARLRQPISGETWVIWRWEWPFTPGEHVLTVRCTDGKGSHQVEARTPVLPNGATGLDHRRVEV